MCLVFAGEPRRGNPHRPEGGIKGETSVTPTIVDGDRMSRSFTMILTDVVPIGAESVVEVETRVNLRCVCMAQSLTQKILNQN